MAIVTVFDFYEFFSLFEAPKMECNNNLQLLNTQKLISHKI